MQDCKGCGESMKKIFVSVEGKFGAGTYLEFSARLAAVAQGSPLPLSLSAHPSSARLQQRRKTNTNRA